MSKPVKNVIYLTRPGNHRSTKQRRKRRSESPRSEPMNILAMTSQTEDIYNHIIEEVTRSMRHKFLISGVQEQTLQKLKEMWERKLKESCINCSSVFGM
jgi:hypothetical protein